MSSFQIVKEEDTARVASIIASMVRGGVSFGLSGELGAGKTTLVRYIVSICGGDVRGVSSPTYTLQHEYPLPHGVVLEHWDLYRLTALPHELEEETPASVVRFIEWPERCPEIIPSLSCQIRISHDPTESSGTARRLEISGPEGDKLSASLGLVLGGV